MSHSYYNKRHAHKVFIDLYKEKMPPELQQNVSAAAQFLKVPYTTLNVMLSENPSSISFTVDVALTFCHKFGINSDVIFFPNDVKSDFEHGKNYTLFKHSSSYHELIDTNYYGTFYGYCHSVNQGSLDYFCLTIQQNELGHAEAVMELHCYSKIANCYVTKTLCGKPMHMEPSIIHIALQGQNGDDFVTLTFTRNHFGNQNEHLLYSYGSMLTSQEGTLRHPEMRSFVYFNQPLNDEDLQYVAGFLKLNQDKFYITADALWNEESGLVSKNPAVEQIVNELGALEHNEVYCFSENVLIASAAAMGMNTNEISAGIMKMKQKSLSPVSIDTKTRATYSTFWKSIMSKYETP